MQRLKVELLRVVVLSVIAGSSIELFMIKTGFYDIVTRLEGERRAERALREKELSERMKALNIKFDVPGVPRED
jgi:hypothetical protein